MNKLIVLLVLLVSSCANSGTKKVVVKMLLDIDKDGNTKNIRVVEPKPKSKTIEKMALKNVSKYRFKSSGKEVKDHEITMDFDPVK